MIWGHHLGFPHSCLIIWPAGLVANTESEVCPPFGENRGDIKKILAFDIEHSSQGANETPDWKASSQGRASPAPR